MKNKRPMVAVLIPDLNFGGGQKVAATLINYLSKNGIKVYCILYTNIVKYEINKEAEIILLNENTESTKFWRRSVSFIRKIAKVRRIIKRINPDITLSFMSSMNIIALIGIPKKSKIIATHHTFTKRNSLKYFLIKYLYPKAWKVICVSEGLKQELLGINQNLNATLISNPVDIQDVRQKASEYCNKEKYGEFILSVGRLSKEKGIDLLIQALPKLENNTINLIILGDGPELTNLIRLSQTLQLSQRVFFIGFDNNPYKWMRNCKCFILPSRVESFGLVLVEALALQCKIVAFDCRSGPGEILNKGEFGWLAAPGDVNDLSQKINISLSSSVYPPSADKWIKQYDLSFIAEQYMRLIINSIPLS